MEGNAKMSQVEQGRERPRVRRGDAATELVAGKGAGAPPGELDFAQVLDNLYDGVYCVDDQRRITYWNRAAERISGYRAAEVVGSRCADNILVHVDPRGNPLCLTGCPLTRALSGGEPQSSDVYLRHKDGHRVPVQVRVSPLNDAAGQIVGAVEVFSDNSNKRAMTERISNLERLAMLDQLTELPNRRYLEMNLALRVNELQRYAWPFGILLVDIDHFKEINDTYGHDIGDRALKMISRTLSYSSRVFDVVGRWGGEEFLAIVSHIDDVQLLNVAERLRAMIEQSILEIPEGLIQVTASIGASMAEPGEDADKLLRRVDRRLYRAKNDGRNRIVATSPGVEPPKFKVPSFSVP